MAETIREYVGVRAVRFTPDTGVAVDFPVVDGDTVEHAVEVEDIRHKSASGLYDVFQTTIRIRHLVTVNCKDITKLIAAALAVETLGTLTWTLIGKGLAASKDAVCSAPAKVVNRPAFPGTDGASAMQSSIQFLLISPDGTSDPLTTTAST